MVDVDLARSALRVLRRDGARGVAQRAVRRAYKALDAQAFDFPLSSADVADAATLAPVRPGPVGAAGPVVGWLTAPPSLGSGGHTTMFRMVRALEESGVRCVIFLHDRYGGDIVRHARVVRTGWPEIRAEVVSAEGGITGVDACFATSWDTAHILAVRGGPGVRRLYFVQDFEPFFYPRGSMYALAEESYRLGFRHVALGGAVGRILAEEVGVAADVVPFGCDTQTYRLTATAPRSGVVFYAKPSVARRGYIHVRLALEEFHRRHPEQEIHAYGDAVPDLAAPVTWHGRMWPEDLNALYNRTLGGLAMSFTNITLVAEEMLCAGTIPVVNDSWFGREVLTNPHVVWARPTPRGIADGLSEVVREAQPGDRARAAAQSVRGGWSATQQAVLAIVRDELGLDRPSGAGALVALPGGEVAGADRTGGEGARDQRHGQEDGDLGHETGITAQHVRQRRR